MSRLYVARVSSCMILRRTPGQVFDNYAVTVMIGEDPYTLGLFDTAGACPIGVCIARLALMQRARVV